MERVAAALIALLAQGQEWEKDWDTALARAAKERRPIVVVFGSKRLKTGSWCEGRLKRGAFTEICVQVRVNVDDGLPKPWPPVMTRGYEAMGGILVMTPDATEGECSMEQQLLAKTAADMEEWVLGAVERLCPPWEPSAFAAELRAKREGKPLLVLVGQSRHAALTYRAMLDRVVLVRSEKKPASYPFDGNLGGVLLDADERLEIASFKGAKTAEQVRIALDKAIAEWSKRLEERRKNREAAEPWVCGYCGYRSAEAESCCGEAMAKPELPVWEKTFASAMGRALKERRVLVAIFLKDAKEFALYQEMASEPRLAAMAGRVVFFAEEAAEAGDRPKELGVKSGVVVLAGREGRSELTVLARLEGLPGAESVRHEVGSAVRKMPPAGSQSTIR